MKPGEMYFWIVYNSDSTTRVILTKEVALYFDSFKVRSGFPIKLSQWELQ